MEPKLYAKFYFITAGLVGGLILGFVFLFILGYLKIGHFAAINAASPVISYGYLAPSEKIVIFLSLTLSGALLGWTLFFSRQNKYLVSKNFLLEEANKTKTEFVYFIAHQLRAPISTVRFSLLMWLNEDFGKVNKGQKSVLTNSVKEIDHLLAIIANLLEIPKIEQHSMKIQKTSIFLDEFLLLMKEVIGRHGFNFEERGIAFSYIFPETNKPFVLSIDWKQIKQVVESFLENAWRYTATAGQVKIEVKIEENNLIASVSDSGIGIPEKEADRIFSKFFRATNARANSTKGTGIGLYLSKYFIEAHGGRIWFESQENKGSTFYFSLPFEPTAQEFLRKI